MLGLIGGTNHAAFRAAYVAPRLSGWNWQTARRRHDPAGSALGSCNGKMARRALTEGDFLWTNPICYSFRWIQRQSLESQSPIQHSEPGNIFLHYANRAGSNGTGVASTKSKKKRRRERKEIVMFKEFTGRYHVHESSRSFADVVAALEAAVGSVENETFDHELSEARDPSDFEERMHRHESTSGFM